MDYAEILDGAHGLLTREGARLELARQPLQCCFGGGEYIEHLFAEYQRRMTFKSRIHQYFSTFPKCVVGPSFVFVDQVVSRRAHGQYALA